MRTGGGSLPSEQTDPGTLGTHGSILFPGVFPLSTPQSLPQTPMGFNLQIYMLKIFRNLTLISKDDFDQALFLCTTAEDTQVPKTKYVKPIIQCLKGQDQKLLPLDGFTRFYDLLLQVSYHKWITALKIAHLFFLCLENHCNVFVEAVCINKLFDKIKFKPLPKKLDDPPTQLHVHIAQGLYAYLQYRYENFLYFQNALADFEEKQDYQKVFIVHKIILAIQLIVKLHKDLDISLEKFPQFLIVRPIVGYLLADLSYFYPKVQAYLDSKMAEFLSMEQTTAEKLYQSYTDTLKLARPLQAMQRLNAFVEPPPPPITLFHVDQAVNKQIELHFKNLKKTKFEIVRFDDDSLLEEPHSNTPPKPILQQFTTLVASKSHVQLITEPEPLQIEYRKTHTQSIKTERAHTFRQKEESMLQSIVSTSDNSVRQGGLLSHQSSFKTEFFEPHQSPLNFLSFQDRKR